MKVDDLHLDSANQANATNDESDAKSTLFESPGTGFDVTSTEAYCKPIAKLNLSESTQSDSASTKANANPKYPSPAESNSNSETYNYSPKQNLVFLDE